MVCWAGFHELGKEKSQNQKILYASTPPVGAQKNARVFTPHPTHTQPIIPPKNICRLLLVNHFGRWSWAPRHSAVLRVPNGTPAVGVYVGGWGRVGSLRLVQWLAQRVVVCMVLRLGCMFGSNFYVFSESHRIRKIRKMFAKY